MKLRRWPVRDRVLVNLVDGRAFDAILYAQRGPLLELANAKLLDPQVPDPAPVDGRVLVERDKVLFVQVL